MDFDLKQRLKKVINNPSYISWKIRTTAYRKIDLLVKQKILKKKLAKSNLGNIALFHIGRSGSTLIGDMINQNPKIYWDGEVFNDIVNSHCKTKNIIEDPLKILNSRMNLSGKNKFYGFEIKFFHIRNFKMDFQEFLEELEKLNFNKFIVIERKNYLRKILSSVKARITSEWHAPKKSCPINKKIKININKLNIDNKEDTLYNFLEEYNKDFNELKNKLIEKKHLWLTYENDIQGNPFIAYEKIVSYLNITNQKVKIRYGKTNPFPLIEILSNYDEIKILLEGSTYEWMLNG
ncbi:hypothetical protein DSCW_03950 [Desulfosarcina widdelii]|uniref:Sulfotransferase domain-containing protein n=1 Tax=Desulfosarcina widdelii TaxID=947919 RepID=A0A5K7YWJ1_9BACT|nr:hypothetical protein [Desulfosarcina widdelii]BBO72978.1 hypothetical protein DSCW_03950 [Desulfosarcina widdelii]